MGGAKNIGEALVPDLANAAKIVRKRRAPKHDFKDGNGKVFAHRHENGGGWVADTAYVAKTVKVTRNAQVFDFARIYDECRIEGTAQVCGHAHLYNSARAFGNARVMNYAVLRNTAQVGNNVFIGGAAVVSGNAAISGNVVVTEQATVHNTVIEGPRKNGTTRIDGAAKVSGGRLNGLCQIGGAAVVDRGTLTHVWVTNEARIVLATISTITPNGFWSWLNHGSGQWTGHPGTGEICSRIEGSVIGSYYSGPPLVMGGETLMARCHIYIHMYGFSGGFNGVAASDWQSLTLDDMEMLIRVENGQTTINEVRQRVHNGRNPLPIATPIIPPGAMVAGVGAPPIPVRGVAPDPGVSRQRRLLRLGE